MPSQAYPNQFRPQGNFSTHQPSYQHPPQIDPNEEKFNQIQQLILAQQQSFQQTIQAQQ